MIFQVVSWTFATFTVCTSGLGTELRGISKAQQSFLQTKDKPMKSVMALPSRMSTNSVKPISIDHDPKFVDHSWDVPHYAETYPKAPPSKLNSSHISVQKHLQLGSEEEHHVHVTMEGFSQPWLNGRYFAQPDKIINGEITYQHANGQFFLWYASACGWWWMAWEGQRAADMPQCGPGWAYLGDGKDILDPSRPKGWTQYTTKWDMLPRAGVYGFSCGAFTSGDVCNDAKNCKWNGKLCNNDWSVIHPEVGVKYFDIRQGQLATCYFLTAIASIAEYHPNIIADMFVDREKWNGDKPIYTTKWILNGKPTTVVVDDFVPVDDNLEPRFVTYNDGYDFWPLVLEKAWAKIYRSYKDVQFGWVVEVFKAITQAPVTRITHSETTKEELWAKMEMAYAQKWPMASLTQSNPSNNLPENHAWSCLGVGEIGDTKYVKMYNPHSQEFYEGEMEDDQNDGYFRMTLDEYFKAFYFTSFASVIPDYVTSSKSFPISMQSVQQQFTMTMDDPFTVQLQWPGTRDIVTTGCPNFALTVGFQVCLKDECVDATREGEEAVFKADMPGGAGTYVVAIYIVIGEEWVKEYTLTTYAKESTEFQDVATLLVATSNQTKAATLSHTAVVRHKISQGANVTLISDASMSCEEAAARRDKLNNADEIAAGEDSLFPHSSNSIARSKDADCGDPAMGINLPCDGKWASFREIMKTQAR